MIRLQPRRPLRRDAPHEIRPTGEVAAVVARGNAEVRNGPARSLASVTGQILFTSRNAFFWTKTCLVGRPPHGLSFQWENRKGTVTRVSVERREAHLHV